MNSPPHRPALLALDTIDFNGPADHAFGLVEFLIPFGEMKTEVVVGEFIVGIIRQNLTVFFLNFGVFAANLINTDQRIAGFADVFSAGVLLQHVPTLGDGEIVFAGFGQELGEQFSDLAILACHLDCKPSFLDRLVIFTEFRQGICQLMVKIELSDSFELSHDRFTTKLNQGFRIVRCVKNLYQAAINLRFKFFRQLLETLAKEHFCLVEVSGFAGQDANSCQVLIECLRLVPASCTLIGNKALTRAGSVRSTVIMALARPRHVRAVRYRCRPYRK